MEWVDLEICMAVVAWVVVEAANKEDVVANEDR